MGMFDHFCLRDCTYPGIEDEHRKLYFQTKDFNNELTEYKIIGLTLWENYNYMGTLQEQRAVKRKHTGSVLIYDTYPPSENDDGWLEYYLVFKEGELTYLTNDPVKIKLLT